MPNEFSLFAEDKLSNYLNKRTWEIKKRIVSEDANVIRSIAEDEYVAGLVNLFTVEPLTIKLDGISVLVHDVSLPAIKIPREITGDWGQPGVRYNVETATYYLPYTGDSELFRYEPEQPLAWTTRVYLDGESLCFDLHNFYRSAQRLKEEADIIVGRIKLQLDNLNRHLLHSNNDLSRVVTTLFQQQKSRLEGTDPISVALGYPVRKREDVPDTYIIPRLRKISHFSVTGKANSQTASEPFMDSSNYEDILFILGNMARAMEYSPRTFARLSEEEIRDFFLIYLNGYFEGQATGETFNNEGRTDILVRVDGKNVFIAECKFWDGERHFSDTIDQLLRYVGWRDRKTAILLFNKKRHSSSVLSKVEKTVIAHPKYKRPYALSKVTDETVKSFVFGQPTDSNVDLLVTVMVFNVPSSSESI